MRILIVGGTGFIGSFVTRNLAALGHEVTVFHRGLRGATSLPPSVMHIQGDRDSLAEHQAEFARINPQVVLDCILSSGRQARTVMETFRGIAERVVALSSQDVYRAYDVLRGIEPGPLQPIPLTEESELRARLNPYTQELLGQMRQLLPWLDDEYDKIPVEWEVLGEDRLAGTVLRLPMVYGPGDPLHRLFPYLKRMDDARPALLLQDDSAQWRGSRGYVENVAAAVALAVTSPRSIGRIYNIAEGDAFSESGWAQLVGRTAGWSGRVAAIPKELIPAHLKLPYRSEQHWVVSSQRIREELGFTEPVSLETALARTIEWERANPPSIDPAQFDYAAEDAALAAAGASGATSYYTA